MAKDKDMGKPRPVFHFNRNLGSLFPANIFSFSTWKLHGFHGKSQN